MARRTPTGSNQYLGAGGRDRVLVASVVNPKLKTYEGKTIAAIAADEKKDPRDAVIDLVIADRANVACIIFIMDEKDVRDGAREPARGLLHGLAGRRDRRHLLARRDRTRAAGPRPRASSATTCATRRCSASRRRSAR